MVLSDPTFIRRSETTVEDDDVSNSSRCTVEPCSGAQTRRITLLDAPEDANFAKFFRARPPSTVGP